MRPRIDTEHGNLIAGVILCTFSIVGGLGILLGDVYRIVQARGNLPVECKGGGGFCWLLAIIGAIIAALFLLAGAGLWAFLRDEWSLTVGICENGFFVRTRKNCRASRGTKSHRSVKPCITSTFHSLRDRCNS